MESNEEYRKFLEDCIGFPIEFKVLGNPKIYRGILSEVNHDHFSVDIEGSVPVRCNYSSLEGMTILSKNSSKRV